MIFRPVILHRDKTAKPLTQTYWSIFSPVFLHRDKTIITNII